MYLRTIADKISCKDIKSGDIVLFHGTEGGVEGLIRKITISDVSHAAICINEGKKIIVVEERKGGIQTNIIEDDMGDRQYAFVKRITNVSNMVPVLFNANKYILQHIPFAYTQFPLLLLIVFFRKLPLNPKIKNYVYRICEVVLAELVEKLNRTIYGNKKPMVCSEFVYLCFSEAAQMTGIKDYRLHVSSEFDIKDIPVTLFSLIKNHFYQNSNTLFHKCDSPELFFDSDLKKKDINSMCNELIKEVDKNESDIKGNIEQIIDNNLLKLAQKIGFVIHKLGYTNKNHMEKSDLPLSLAALDSVKQYFVTPEDLLNRCSNTKCIGVAGKV